MAGEVLAVHRAQQERRDDDQDDEDLPADQGVVDPREPADAEEVHDDEEGHQDHGAHVAEPGERVDGLAGDRVRRGERGVLRGVLQRRLDLDGGRGRHRHPGDPAGGVARERSERQVGEADDTTGQGEHRPELGVHQGDQQDHHAAEGPGDDRRGSGRDGRVQRAEQPAGADDRADAGEQQPDHADMTFEIGLFRRSGLGVRGHVHHLFSTGGRTWSGEIGRTLSDTRRVTWQTLGGGARMPP